MIGLVWKHLDTHENDTFRQAGVTVWGIEHERSRGK